MIWQKKERMFMLACLKQQLKKTEIVLMPYARSEASTSLSYFKKKKVKYITLFLFSGTRQPSKSSMKQHTSIKKMPPLSRQWPPCSEDKSKQRWINRSQKLEKDCYFLSNVHKWKYWECCYFFDPANAIVIINFCDKQKSVQRSNR